MKIFNPDDGEYSRITFAILSELGISNMDSFLDPQYWNTDEMVTTDLDECQKYFPTPTTLVHPTTPISVTDPDQFIGPHPGENYINKIEPVAHYINVIEPVVTDLHSGEKLPCEITWLTLGETGENVHKLPCENTWLTLGETGENVHIQGRNYILLFIFHMIRRKTLVSDCRHPNEEPNGNRGVCHEEPNGNRGVCPTKSPSFPTPFRMDCAVL
eukprot:scaffold3002_cov64-Attheya_sp.AAC.12